ncbi:MAG TPA: SOS response-associated peptidase [Bacteroidales bacterium]|nr:SOS response-associated peptidase [Bacteroidales bacterium]HPT11038.1 SOS response-associated peptidase [Bacteroidales bacterium]
MCFTVSVNIVKEELEHRYGAQLIDPDKYRPSYYYHAQSLPLMPVVCNNSPGRIELLNWGLIPSWAKDEKAANEVRRKTLNARAETLSEKPSFSKASESQRCLIPVTGFFEWQDVNGKKIPWYIRMAGEEIFSIAGLWDTWVSPGGITIKTFTLITVDANSLMAEIHNTKKRMPALLTKETEHLWIRPSLSSRDASFLLEPVPSDALKAHTVGPLISDRTSDHNTPELIKPYAYPSQGSLF